MAEILCLSRKLCDRNNEMHQGIWNKSSKNCFEIRGKTLGIIGYGHIGSQLSVLAEAIGMHVIFYDIKAIMPHGLARRVNTLEELFENSDFISLHVPETLETTNLVNSEMIEKMKRGSFLINASRGSVVSEIVNIVRLISML